MSGDATCTVDELSWTQRVDSLKNASTRLLAVRDQVQTDLNRKQQEVEALSQRIELLLKVGELFRSLMDKMVYDQVKTIESIVTEGLQSIFHDQDLHFESDVSTKYNRIAIDFLIRQGDDEMAIRGKPLESFGGGPSSIASLVLRVLTLLRLKRFPILLLDETLAAVSDDYLDQAGAFLAKLAESSNMDILLVTHKQAFLEHAHKAYQGYEDTDGERARLGLRCIRG